MTRILLAFLILATTPPAFAQASGQDNCVMDRITLDETWWSDNQTIMGTDVRIEVMHESKTKASGAIMDIMVEMKKIDEAMSPFVSGSQLSELNRFASSRPVEVSAELFELINESVKLAELTHGAFDITFASMDHSLNFREGAKENDAVLAVALSGIDYTSISLDEENHQVKFLRSGIHIGLSRVANGYAVDKGIEILRYHGITQSDGRRWRG